MLALAARRNNERPLPYSRADWLDRALAVLVEEGVEAVQVTRLARALEVTRGSFYWHFRDRADLLEALIEEWRHRNSGVMIEALANAASLADGILSLFSVWVDHQLFDPRLDQAMRDWARRSEEVRAVVTAEDDNRIAAIAAFFQRFGYDDPEAFIRARVLYFTQVSYYALGVKEPMTRRMSYLAAYYRCFTGAEIDEAAAEGFIRRMIAWEAEHGVA